MTTSETKAGGVFDYGEEIHPQVSRAAEDALKSAVLGCYRIRRGTANHVYKVVSESGPVIVKVFRRRNWPEEDKPRWVDERLSEHGIPHPKILYYSRESSVFPNGFMISEYVEGQDADDVLNRGTVTAEEFYETLGVALKRVHAIKFKRYGHVNKGAGTHSDFIAQRKVRTGIDVDQLRESDDEENLYWKVKATVNSNLQPFKDSYAPVLTHGDPHPRNCIWTGMNQFVMVDWDNAASSVWVRDYAHVTFLSLKRAPAGAAAECLSRVRDAFFKGYGYPDCSFEQIEAVRKTLHLIWAYNLLPVLRRKDAEAFNKTLDYLRSLL